RMDTLIDPDHILIPLRDSIRGPENEPMLASLVYSPEKDNFYPAFFTGADRETDIPVLSSGGFLSYDMSEETFMVSDTTDNDMKPYLAFHSDNCVLEGVGPLEMEIDLPYVTLDLYGQAAHYIIPDSTKFDLVIGLDFFFDMGIQRQLSKTLSSANLPGTETTDIKFVNFLKQIVPVSEVDRIISDLSNFGTVRRLPNELNYMMLFTQVKFNWNPASSSFVSYDDLGMFSLGGEIVNGSVPGYIEIERKPTGFGVINIYFELPGGEWYFFSYRNYIMQTISSNEVYNNEILDLREDKRIVKSREEEVPYEFVISSKRKMLDFKRRMEEMNGIDVQ
ncbi:MAG: hypothetical protein ABFS05_11560, partial [Bacteroidota bacterium]